MPFPATPPLRAVRGKTLLARYHPASGRVPSESATRRQTLWQLFRCIGHFDRLTRAAFQSVEYDLDGGKSVPAASWLLEEHS